MEPGAKGARRPSGRGRVDPAEIGGIVEAQRIGDHGDRQVGIDQIEPGLADQPVEDLGKLSVLAGVREFPVRVKCASLAWHTLRAALEREEHASTE